MSFVRQRRDTGPTDLELTDLDRTRRQQAFIVSLAVQLRQAKTFTDFGTLQSLIDTAKTYIAVDDGLDLLSFASQAQRLSGGNIDFQTLPVERYETIDSKSVNIVDLAKIRAIVDAVLNPPTTKPEAPATTATTAPTGAPTRPTRPPRRFRRTPTPTARHRCSRAPSRA